METFQPVRRFLSRSRPAPHPRDILLAGAVRGGTTLACELLNEVPNVVAVDEPLGRGLAASGRAGAVAYVAHTMARSRRSLHKHGRVRTKHVGGTVRGDKIAPPVNGERTDLTEIGEIEITKPLDHDFTLVLKQPVMFTAALGVLSQVFPCFAVVRNPVAVICSWETLPSFNVSNGHQPNAEAMAPELAARLSPIENITRRQIELLDWIFAQYRDLLPLEHVIRYEDLADQGMSVLSVIAPEAGSVERRVENRNHTYDLAARQRIGELVLDRGGAWLRFYTRDEIAALLD